MKQKPITIVGAGLAGLIAAHAWPQAELIEAQQAPEQKHSALLRFRSDSVARLTGIEFRKVRVRKGIYYEGEFVAPNIALANAYSRKVLGRLVGERSIWNVEAADRYVAPKDFYSQLLDNVGGRVRWGEEAGLRELTEGARKQTREGIPTHVITTAPLSITTAVFYPSEPYQAFDRAAIRVERFYVPDCDLHQTVYFPDPSLSAYRASITGDTLIVEHVGDATDGEMRTALSVSMEAFGISAARKMGDAKQNYGKIAPIDEAARKRLVHRLTAEHGLLSLGRFATWRNLLLDDIVTDIDVLKRLMRVGLHDVRLAAS